MDATKYERLARELGYDTEPIPDEPIQRRRRLAEEPATLASIVRILRLHKCSRDGIEPGSPAAQHLMRVLGCNRWDDALMLIREAADQLR